MRWKNFKDHLHQIHSANAFQKNRFPELENWKSWSGFDDFTSSCPLTSKKELEHDRVLAPPHGTNRTFSNERYVRFSQTSGTEGQSMVWLDTEDDWQWMLENWKIVLSHAGVKKGARSYFAFSFGPFLGFWTAYEAAVALGCICIPGGGQSSEARLRAILKHKVEYLFCTPTYVMRLIDCARELDISLSEHSLKKIIVAGECGGSVSEMRLEIDRAWGRKSLIFDHYGMTEVGPVAYEIPGGQGGLRIISDSYFAEVIDVEKLSPLKDGQMGELVLTPLGRTASPLLRYRTGDMVRVKRGIDDCGRPTFDLIGGILGRVDGMEVIKGINLHPSSIDAIVRKFIGISEYKVEIDKIRGMKEIKILAECEKSAARSLELELRDVFSLRIPVETIAYGSLPRFDMKANRWVKIQKTISN